MQIIVPKNIYPVTRLIVETPSGVIANMEGDSTFQMADVKLPEGVTEDEVSARVEFLDNGRKVISGLVVKEAIKKPVEDDLDDEDEIEDEDEDFEDEDFEDDDLDS